MLVVRWSFIQMINLSPDHLCLTRDKLDGLPSSRFLSKCTFEKFRCWIAFLMYHRDFVLHYDFALMFSLRICRSKRIIRSRYILSFVNSKKLFANDEKNNRDLRRERLEFPNGISRATLALHRFAFLVDILRSRRALSNQSLTLYYVMSWFRCLAFDTYRTCTWNEEKEISFFHIVLFRAIWNFRVDAVNCNLSI